jgi:hypothetical protein
MATSLPSFDHLSDPDLLREVTRLAAREREATASLVASLAVLDQRRLYLAEGYGSMFAYCTQALHLSEASAYKRITAARTAHRFPAILERLAEGTVSLATVNLLAAHLTVENHVAVLDEVRHHSKREVEEIVARLQPRPDAPNTVRKLPAPKSPAPAVDVAGTMGASAKPDDTVPVEPLPVRASTSSPPVSDTTCAATVDRSAPRDTHAAETRSGQTATVHAPHGAVTPLAPARYKLTVTLSAETYEKLRQAQDLLRHAIPTGDLAVLVDRALTVLLREAAKTKLAATDRPRSTPSQKGSTPDGGAALSVDSTTTKAGSRRIPAAVKREVWKRDGGRCAFVSSNGHRCRERAWLEFHHVVPYAKRGEPSVRNIQLRCKRHNAYEAERDFGPWTAMRVRETGPVYGSDRVFVRDVLQPHVGTPGRTRGAWSWRAQAGMSLPCSSPRGELGIPIQQCWSPTLSTETRSAETSCGTRWPVTGLWADAARARALANGRQPSLQLAARPVHGAAPRPRAGQARCRLVPTYGHPDVANPAPTFTGNCQHPHGGPNAGASRHEISALMRELTQRS